jgi:hypothetical protein
MIITMSHNLFHFKQYLQLFRPYTHFAILTSVFRGGYRAGIMKKQSMMNHKNIRDYLKKTGQTEAELGKLVNISQSQVNKLKNGTRRPSPEVAARLEAVTGIPLRALLLKVEPFS